MATASSRCFFHRARWWRSWAADRRLRCPTRSFVSSIPRHAHALCAPISPLFRCRLTDAVQRGTTIFEAKFTTPIVGVRLNRRRMAVLLSGRVDLYDMVKAVSLLRTIPTPRAAATCALSPHSENCYFAYPQAGDNGAIVLYDGAR